MKYRAFEIVGLTETIAVNIFVVDFTGTAEGGSKQGLKKIGVLNLQLLLLGSCVFPTLKDRTD